MIAEEEKSDEKYYNLGDKFGGFVDVDCWNVCTWQFGLIFNVEMQSKVSKLFENTTGGMFANFKSFFPELAKLDFNSI